jgi:hypothetical protein
MSAHIGSLQEQVNSLYHDLNNLRAQLGANMPMHPSQQSQHTPIDPTLQSPFHRPSYSATQVTPGAPLAPMSPTATRQKSQSQSGQQPTFRGPTSSDFNFGVAKSSLQTMGITGITNHNEDEAASGGPGTREQTPDGVPPSRQIRQEWHSDKDPIWSVTQDEAVRLCRVYEDEMGLMYPVLDINKVIAYTQKLYRFMEAAHRSGLMQQGLPGADAIDDEDTNILKMVIAVALTVEGSGRSDLGRRMFDYVHPAIENLLLGNVGTKGIRLLILTVSDTSSTASGSLRD